MISYCRILTFGSNIIYFKVYFHLIDSNSFIGGLKSFIQFG